MTRLEELIHIHFSRSERKFGDSPMKFARELIEECAKKAEINHWNCNCQVCSRLKRVASAIRSLALEAERKE